MAKLVSKIYGDALFQLAMESQSIDEILSEIKSFQVILESNQDLVKLMNHPKIDKEEKRKVMETIFDGKIRKDIQGFLDLLIRKDRFGQIDAIFEYFIHQVKEYRNIGTAYVTSAVSLREDQKEEIRKKLIETSKYVEMEMIYQVDAQLIGGLVIRIGDRVVDSSVRTRINELSKELSKIQLKAGECAP